MLTRREIIGTTGLALLGITAGCSQIPFVGNEPLEFEASRTTVPDATLSDTGYAEADAGTQVIERTVEVGGQSQDIVVTNWRADYDKAVDLAELGVPNGGRVQASVFTVLSSPQVSVLGRSFNPIEDMKSRELAEMVQDNYDGMKNIEQVSEEGALVSGQETTAGEFRADAQLAEVGTSVELAMHITEAVEVGGDFVVTVGAYPSRVQKTEKDNVFSMMEAVDHEG